MSGVYIKFLLNLISITIKLIQVCIYVCMYMSDITTTVKTFLFGEN